MLQSFSKPLKRSSFFALIIIVLFGNATSSFLPYEFENDGDVESVVFTAEDNGEVSLGQLYLRSSSSHFFFQLRQRDNDTKSNRNALVKRYASKGMHPTIIFWNITWNVSLELNELVETEEDVYWRRNVTVSELFSLQDGNYLRRWNYIAELGKGLNVFQKKGSLIITEAEPLLSLQFGDPVQLDAISMTVFPSDVVLRSSPCSSVVAGVVPVANMSDENPNSGCYFGVTYNYFSPSSIKWYNLLHLSSGTPDKHSLCKQASFSQCSSLSILDFALLRNHLLFVTTHGMVVSESFQEALRNGSGTKLSFSKVNSIHPIIDEEAKSAKLKRSDIRLFYTPHCYSNFVSDSREEVCIVYYPSSSNNSLVVCSHSPYDKWKQLGFEGITSDDVVVSLVHDIQRETRVILLKNVSKGNSVVQVYNGLSQSFPTYKFGQDETVIGLYFHLFTSTIFAYGSQVWQSLDGGNSFHKVTSFQNQDVVSFSFDLFGEMYSFVTKLGLIVIGKVGIHRTSAIAKITNDTLTTPLYSQVVMDAKIVVIVKMKFNASVLLLYHDTYKIKDSSDSKETLQSTMLVQFKTATRVEFYSTCNCFTAVNTGKVIHSKFGGSAVIILVEKASSLASNLFKQRIVGNVFKPFFELKTNMPSMLEVSWSRSNASLTLLDEGGIASQWQEDDVGKTVVLPGGYSFLLMHRLNKTTYIGTSYFPWASSKPFQGIYEGWAVYDFRDPDSSDTSWWMKEDTCKSVFIEATDLRPQFYHLDSTDQLDLSATVVSKNILNRPVPRVLISNPGLFTIKSLYQWSHLNTTLKITIKQRPFAIGSSPLIFVLENSSVFCYNTAITIIVHSGCPPSKTLRYIYPSTFTDEIFLDSKAIDSKGIVRNLKLPYNYRPPSARGIAIPMTSNIYNVDPQKPHYRRSYAITRETVRYKQCSGAKERAGCGCSRAMRRSSLREHSDCIDTAYRLSFSERLRPKFLISRDVRETKPSLHSPYYLEEVNDREDFVIINPSNKTVLESTAVIMEENINSSIEFMGSGLYHFRAHIVRENYTFCELTADFVVFVVETPLPYPVKDIVMACTAMGFSSLLYLTYLTLVHGKKKIKYD